MKTLYALMANTDKIEGRGFMYVVCCTESRSTAEDLITSPTFGQKFGPMGQPGQVSDIREVQVVESASDLLLVKAAL
jgi:hypothetical protein